MSKTRDTGFINNILKYDNDGNVSVVSGSTTLLFISSSGAIITTGIISGSNALSASYAVSASNSLAAATASYVLNGVSASYAASASNSISGAYAVNSTTASFSLTGTSASYAVNSTTASYAVGATNAANSTLFNNTASSVFATTGSNTLTGVQYVSNTNNAIGFSNTTASIYTDGGLQVTKDAYFSSSMFIKGNLTVFGTQSVSFISSSQLNIGTNLITVNTDTPSIRFGGLAVYDSGSTGLTGSILWDSQNNHWVYTNPSGSSYSGGMLISGPRASSLGSEQGTTNNALMKGMGGDHITSSGIFENGASASFYTNALVVSSSGDIRFGSVIGNTHQFTGSVSITGSLLSNGAIGIGTTSPTSGYSLDVNGASYFRSTTVITGSGGTYLNIRNSGGSDSAVFVFDGTNTGYVGLNVGSNSNKFVIYYAADTRMAIDTSGRVGFGTTSPGYNLEISSGSASPTELAITNTNVAGAARLSLRNAERNFIITSNTTDDLLSFSYDGSNRLQFNTTNQWFNSGNVGIGTTNPATFLHVLGSNTSARGQLSIQSNNTSNAAKATWYYDTFNSGEIGTTSADFYALATNNFLFYAGGSERMRITSGGLVGIGTAEFSVNNNLSLGRVFGFVQDINSGYIQANMSNSGNYIVSQFAVRIHLDSALGEITFLNAISGTANNAVTLTPRMRITSGGNVGIGITNPSRRLHIYATTNVFEGILVENSTSNAYALYQSKTGNSSLWQFGTWDNNSFRVSISGVGDFLTITSGGRVGIGTTNPDAGLQIAQSGQDDQLTIGSIANNRDHAAFMCSGANKAEILRYQSATRLMIASSGAIANVDVLPGGSVGVRLNAGNTSWSAFTSDERKKKNFETVPGLEALLQINPVKYHFKTQDDSEIKKLGFIAQNLQPLIPEMVHPNGEKAEDETDILTIIPDYILPVLVKAIQEQQAQIDELKAIING